MISYCHQGEQRQNVTGSTCSISLLARGPLPRAKRLACMEDVIYILELLLDRLIIICLPSSNSLSSSNNWVFISNFAPVKMYRNRCTRGEESV